MGREAEGEGETDTPLGREPDVGLDPRTLRSWPELKAEALTHWATQVPLYICFLKFLFIYLTESTSRQSDRQREREKQAFRWARSLMWDSIPGPWNHDLSWRQMLNWLSHPGVPANTILIPNSKLFYSNYGEYKGKTRAYFSRCWRKDSEGREVRGEKELVM